MLIELKLVAVACTWTEPATVLLEVGEVMETDCAAAGSANNAKGKLNITRAEMNSK